MDQEQMMTALQAPLDPKHIKPPPRGKFGEYVDALHVIREANRIFGEFGWSYEITRLEQASFIEMNEQVRTSYICTVKATVYGVTREGAAVGVGIGKIANTGDVIESAVKEAETDALKRALRSFGNTFGLALYDKDKANREVGTPFDAEGFSTKIIDSIKGKADMDSLNALWNHKDVKASLAKMDGLKQAELETAYSDRAAELS